MKFILSIVFLFLGWQIADAQIVSETPAEFVKLRKGKVAMKQYHNNGQISQTGWFKYNAPHGAWASFDENGHIVAEARYERGKKHGTWRFWDATGKLLCEIEYHYGNMVAARQYDLQGTVIAAVTR